MTTLTQLEKKVMSVSDMDGKEGPASTTQEDIWACFDAPEIKKQLRSQINGQLVVWGYVVAYRECGGIGYPKNLNGMGNLSMTFGLPDYGTAFCSIEKALKGTAPAVRGILYFQYAKPHMNFIEARKEHDRNSQLATTVDEALAMVEEQSSEQTGDALVSAIATIEELVEQVYGGDLPESTRKSLATNLRTVRSRWVDSVVSSQMPRRKR